MPPEQRPCDIGKEVQASKLGSSDPPFRIQPDHGTDSPKLIAQNIRMNASVRIGKGSMSVLVNRSRFESHMRTQIQVPTHAVISSQVHIEHRELNPPLIVSTYQSRIPYIIEGCQQILSPC